MKSIRFCRPRSSLLGGPSPTLTRWNGSYNNLEKANKLFSARTVKTPSKVRKNVFACSGFNPLWINSFSFRVFVDSDQYHENYFKFWFIKWLHKNLESSRNQWQHLRWAWLPVGVNRNFLLRVSNFLLVNWNKKMKKQKMNEKKVLCVGLTCLDIVTDVASYPVEDTDQRSIGQSWRRGGNV